MPNRALLTRPTSVPTQEAAVRSVARYPTRPDFKIDPDLFRVLVLERLRVPLPVTEAW